MNDGEWAKGAAGGSAAPAGGLLLALALVPYLHSQHPQLSVLK